MNNGGEAAEMIVRLYLEGFEEVVKLTGTGIKNLVPLLATTLKQESKTKFYTLFSVIRTATIQTLRSM